MGTYKIILDGPNGFGVEIRLPTRFLSIRGFKSEADAQAWIGEQQITANWRAKADEVRTKAGSLPDAPFRQTVLEIATSDEILAWQDEFVGTAERLLGPIDALSDFVDNRVLTPRLDFPDQTHRRDPAVIADVVEAARQALVAPSWPRTHEPDRA
jgi:hypothetical protein